jgi:hypothetical protein
MQDGRSANLCAQIGGSVDQEPSLAVGGHRNARLRARLHPWIACPSQPANRAATIPLRKTTTRRRTEDDGDQAHLAKEVVARRSELGRKVAVDFKADADFDEGGRSPGHDCFLADYYGR